MNRKFTAQRQCFVMLFGLLCAVSSGAALAQEILTESLSVTMSKRGAWDNDVSEIAYVGTRCAALYITIGGYFKQNGTLPEDQARGNDLIERSNTVAFSSMLLSRVAKMSDENFVNRHSVLSRSYVATMATNKQKLNNALHTPIYEDLKFCNTHEHNFKTISDMVNSAAKRSN